MEVVAHQEDPIRAGLGSHDGHRRPERVGLGRDRDLRRGSLRTERLAQSTDKLPIGRHEIRRQDFDIDIDAVETLLLHERDELSSYRRSPREYRACGPSR